MSGEPAAGREMCSCGRGPATHVLVDAAQFLSRPDPRRRFCASCAAEAPGGSTRIAEVPASPGRPRAFREG